jgi:hypothetical protein
MAFTLSAQQYNANEALIPGYPRAGGRGGGAAGRRTRPAN